MTGRTCPVHGEYSESGACRWCEPSHPPAPDASPLPWVERQILVEWPVKADVVGEAPGASALRDVKALTEYDWTRGPVVEDLADAPPAVCSFDLEDAMQELWRRMHARSVSVPIYMPDFAAEDARIDSQHVALRWERVARRWVHKHGPWTMRDYAQQWQFFFEKVLALQIKRLETLHPLLPVPKSEPKP